MFNIGFGEILIIAVLGLLIFGPDRLPEAARKGSQMLRQVREMAMAARKQVTDAAGLDEGQTARMVADLRGLHPRRIASSVLEPLPEEAEEPRDSRRSTGLDPDLN